MAVVVLADGVALAVHLATSGGGSRTAASASTPGAAPTATSSADPLHKIIVTPSSPATQVTSGAGTGTQCRNPRFVSSDSAANWQDGRYNVFQDEWNAKGYDVTQTLYACSYSSWYVVADISSVNGQVKTYPDVNYNVDNTPVSEFTSVTSSFAETSPHVGVYEDAYDIWLNGIAQPGSTEIMIWNENFNQRPKGSVVATASFGGRTYQVWRAGNYVAFVAEQTFTSGTVNLLQMFNYVIAHGWMPPTSALSQVDYGAELVSTNGMPATFSFTNFSVTSS